ncbi:MULTISPECIES: GNAT family N-acetyltransferase [unclassified Bordetella]|uniref:GNAT family N-acetyltransferase n=1 Tax=unclassified Bordetella TaxID=2630031 RepID=UPI00132201BF|nr:MULTISPECIES: GNAT family N-acetyltransferase [unclassified Bordetella]MVW73174.1 GNAT family N-acetyltransferase [Bordetella sp. 15P40C-2]MVW79908.1 GNAT family N-acetyltransferase [Bordetella sp. 02P26C-1]
MPDTAPLHFRRARRDDLDTLVTLLADDVLGREREDASMPAVSCYVLAFEAIDRDPNQFLAVAERYGHIIGCLQLSFIPGLSRRGLWRGQIESVRIASGERGSGIGRLMFEWAIAQCRERGCGLVQLTTDKKRGDARRFYESLGFTASHEGMKLELGSL